MGRASVTRHAVTKLNVYSVQSEKLSDSDLPIRQMPWKKAMGLVKRGEAIWQYGKNGQIKGIRFTERQRVAPRTPCTLTQKVMMSVSGEGLKSVYEESDERYEREEETLRNKFEVWPLIGDTKAVCVRPRISEEDRKKAMKLLGIAA